MAPDTPTEQHLRYEANDIDRLETHLGVQVGNLSIQSGTEKLVQADIVCSEESWQPEVQYTVTERVGHLSIQQADMLDAGLRFFNRRQNDWQLRFNSRVPIGMTLNCNATKSDLALSGLRLADFDFQSNAGIADITLHGSQPDLKSFFIEANATRINARIGGNFPHLNLLDFELNAAKLLLDLRGEWTHSHNLAIEANAGWVKLIVPSTVGIKVHSQTTMAMFRHSGLRKDVDGWVNAAFDASPITLTIDIEASVSRVEIEVVDTIAVHV